MHTISAHAHTAVVKMHSDHANPNPTDKHQAVASPRHKQKHTFLVLAFDVIYTLISAVLVPLGRYMLDQIPQSPEEKGSTVWHTGSIQASWCFLFSCSFFKNFFLYIMHLYPLFEVQQWWYWTVYVFTSKVQHACLLKT